MAGRTDWSLYLVTDPDLAGGAERVPEVVGEAVRGGAGVVQVRDKTADDGAFADQALAVAAAVREAAAGRSVPVFVNDRFEVARELGLHLHLGPHDMDFIEARLALPERQMIGVSIENEQQLENVLLRSRGADVRPPDVLGLSPVWATATKPDAAIALEVAGTDRIARAAAELGLLSVAIGGIRHDNLDLLAPTAVDGICVVSAVMSARDPRAAAWALLSRWRRAREHTL